MYVGAFEPLGQIPKDKMNVNNKNITVGYAIDVNKILYIETLFDLI